MSQKHAGSHSEAEVLAYLADRVTYGPETGAFRWKWREDAPNCWNARHAGTAAGSKTSKGYMKIRITIEGRARDVLLHRLAWFMTHGQPPSSQIDHINQARCDNRAQNLRDVDQCANMRNMAMPKRNTSGVCGVSYRPINGKYRARAMVNGKDRHVGYFTDIESAAAAVEKFRKDNGFTDLHGKLRG